jgi:hypothetical protein
MSAMHDRRGVLEDRQPGPRNASAGARRDRCERRVTSGRRLAKDHKEGDRDQPGDGDQDEEHWVVVGLDAAVLARYR